jgi:hypothetical protein
VFVAIAAIVMLSLGIRVEAETVAWTNASQYQDGTSIPSAKAAQLQTQMEYRIGSGTFTAFGTATGGAQTFVAPYVTQGGQTSYWRLRHISPLDNNSAGAWSTDYPFVRAYQAPAAPSPISVQ